MENSFSSRRWTNHTFWKRSGTENIHIDTGASNSRREYYLLSWRIRRVSSTTSRLISGCWWSDKRFLIHVRKLHKPPSRWTQSQTFFAERRIIPYSTGGHWRNQNYSYEFGCQARTPHRRLLEHRWVKGLVWSLDRFHTVYSIRRETSRRIFVVRAEIDEKTAYIQARSSMARALEVNGKARQAEGEAKVVRRRDPSWKRKKIAWNLFHWPWGQGIQRNHQECSQEIGNTNGSRYALWDMQEEQAWSDPWQNQWDQIKTCVYFGSQWIHKTACGKVFTESSWRPYCRKREQFIAALQFGTHIYSHAPSHENSYRESSGGQGMGKIGENFGVELDESQK